MTDLERRVAKLEEKRRDGAPRVLIVIGDDDRPLRQYRAKYGRDPEAILRLPEIAGRL
jgi:hypothetical protein